MTMSDYMARERLPELRRQIDQLHYSYLETDDSPQKIEQRKKLEGYIREYLCLVPHDYKFSLRETRDVLHRSAASLEDFSGYRAALAWSAVGQYAANLLAQPWRKEYREIKMYSGFYKHEIEANLVGAELMFEAMGYKHSGQSTLLLEGPICPDQVAHVSRDSLVASVECQLMKNIWETVSSVYNISWVDVLHFRETHVGGAEHACRALTYRCNEINYNNSREDSQYIQQPQHEQQPLYQQPIMQAFPNNTSHMSVHPHSHVDMSGQMSGILHSHSNNTPVGYYNYSGFAPMQGYGVPVRYPMQHYQMVSPFNPSFNSKPQGTSVPSTGSFHYPLQVALPNGYPMGHHGIAMQGYAVPTGQLIELDTPNYHQAQDLSNGEIGNSERLQEYHYNKNNDMHKRNQVNSDNIHVVKQVDQQNKKENTNAVSSMKSISDKRRNDKNLHLSNNNHINSTSDVKGKDVLTNSLESWDYVFKNLESQGYSKDLGERENVLEAKSKSRQNILNLEHEFEVLNLKSNENDKDETSSYDNISQKNTKLKCKSKSFDDKCLKEVKKPVKDQSNLKKQSMKHVESNLNKRQPMKVDKSNESQMALTTSANINIASKLNDKNTNIQAPSGADVVDSAPVRWECAACTYVNSRERDICEICGKSKLQGPETKPLAAGGRECHQCTLVNDRGALTCNACGASLKDSPTYI